MPSQQHLNVHITVATVVENQGRFLMVREERDPSLILMNQPAGHLEANETLVEAALRETLEETAWQVDITDYLGVYICRYNDGAMYFRHTFIAKPVAHLSERTLDKGVIEATWLTADEVLAKRDEHLSPMVAKCLTDYLADKRLPLEAITHI